jgi:hypothetical protein
MNIFILSLIIEECARYHNNKHCIKLICEYAQILCAAHHKLDLDKAPEGLYKLTHKNHPQVLWACKTSSNYQWLYSLFIALCNEYTYRYSKVHASERKLKDLLKNNPKNIPEGPLTLFAITTNSDINEKYRNLIEKDPDNSWNYVVDAYREYYMKDKRSFCVWKSREVPEWYS